MAAGWAAASAAVLGLSAGLLALEGLPGSGPAAALLVLLLAGALAAWSYSFAVAAHGARGGLVSLLAHALLALVLALLHVRPALATGEPARVLLPALLALAAVGAALSLLRELRARRGPLQAASGVPLALPFALLLGLLALLGRA